MSETWIKRLFGVTILDKSFKIIGRVLDFFLGARDERG